MNLVKITHFLSLLTCILVLILTSINTTDLHDNHIHLKHTHITLYVDSNIDEYGQDQIISAALEWTAATHHLVEYDVVRLPAKNLDIQDGIFISKVSPNFPEIVWRDRAGAATLGLYLGRGPVRTILLVTDRLDEETYKTCILHELGHSLGLEHSSLKDFDTLMYPFIDFGADVITTKDLEQFCKLHDCNAKSL